MMRETNFSLATLPLPWYPHRHGHHTETPNARMLVSLAAMAVAPRPNILFLMCDSMDGRVVDPTSPVSKFVATPNLDRLAGEGVNFIRTYAASPQCVPSRTTMLAGRRIDQIRAFDNGNGLAADPSAPGKLDSNCVYKFDRKTCEHWAATQRVNSSFFDALSAVYATDEDENKCTLCIMGKVDIGMNEGSRWGPHVNGGNNDGFHGGPRLNILTRAADIRKPTKPNPRTITNDRDDRVHPEDWKTTDYCIDWLHAKGAAHRSGHAPSSPWFLYCSLNIPHPPFHTNGTWLQSVDQPAVRARPPRWGDLTRYHPHDAYMTTSKAMAGDFSDEAVFLVRRTYYAMVAETDYLMGQVLDAARASGTYDDTLVLFLSDHGEMNMEYRQVRSVAYS